MMLSEITHHAVLFVHPDRKHFAESLWKELQGDSLAHRLHNQTVIDIDTARALREWSNSAYEGERVALLSFHTITLPAQNALLKILEEPRGGVRFILITSNKETLLPTLLSRLQEQSLDKASLSEFSYVKQFLNANHSERMKLPCIVNLISAVDEENRKDREGVRMFILSLAAYLSSHNVASLHAKEVLEIASYAGDPSSSGKALLEYLSLLLPETKV